MDPCCRCKICGRQMFLWDAAELPPINERSVWVCPPGKGCMLPTMDPLTADEGEG